MRRSAKTATTHHDHDHDHDHESGRGDHGPILGRLEDGPCAGGDLTDRVAELLDQTVFHVPHVRLGARQPLSTETEGS